MSFWRCCYEVPGMLLLCDLRGAMWLVWSKDVCACFILHQLRFQHINANCVEVVALTRHVSMSQCIDVFQSFKSIDKQRDETWCFHYVPKSKWQSLKWKQPTSLWPKKAHMSKSQMKILLITFFNIEGIVHFEFIIQGQIVNKLFMWK